MQQLFFKRLIQLSVAALIFQAGVYAAEDPVLVTRSDMALTKNDFVASLSVIPKEKREMMDPTVKQTMIFLENVMIFRKLAQEARELGMDRDPVIAKEMQQASDRALGLRRLEAFEASLKQPDFNAAALEHYKTKPTEFLIPEAVNVSHILIRSEGRGEEAAKRLAEEVRAKALAGADFHALVKEYSDDQSKERNQGDLGMFERSTKEKPVMVKPFEDAAFALSKPGEIGVLVRTQFGYHVIRLIERRAARQKSYEEVKDSIIKTLRDKFIADAKAAYISAIKNDKSIVIHEDAIKALQK